jgi:hypothetical protein
MSGSLPQFWDYIENFHSGELLQDNLLSQLSQAQRSVLFFGDDTWTNLFSDSLFNTRSVSIPSFFIKVVKHTQTYSLTERERERERELTQVLFRILKW